jgi:trehalose 6-phosphate synthase/phosphatase
MAIKLNKADQMLRHEKHWAYVASHTVQHWAANFTQYLAAATDGHAGMKTYTFGLGLDTFRMVALDPSFRKLQAEPLIDAYRRSKRRLILCDYDGTLVPTNRARAARLPARRPPQ